MRFQTDSNTAESAALACLVVTMVVSAFILSSDQFSHWFVIPVAICGVLVGIDAIAWLRGRVGLYDPVGIIGLFGFHFFFLAPLLHVKWGLWMGPVSAPPDWRDWLGYMAILNVSGLICYRFCCTIFKTGALVKPHRTFWQIKKRLFRTVAPICLAIAAAAQIGIYAKMGGIAAFMEARQDKQAFVGWGWLFMISESVPILTTFLVIVRFQQRKITTSNMVGILCALFLVQMVFAGLRGSRSQTIELLFWLVGCIHFLLRPVPRKLIFVGSLFLLAFIYFYSFYKSAGVRGVSQAFSGSEERKQLSQETGRTLPGTLLGDLGRADMQAFVLYRTVEYGRDFTYAKGRTYLGALSNLIPRALLPERPASKLKEGTDIQMGSGTYVGKYQFSSKVYGLAGECMLNFGPVGVPFIYALFGVFVGWVRSYISRLLPGDSRFLLMPLLVYQCFALLIGDSDNVVFSGIKDGFMPTLVVVLCSVRHRPLLSYSFQQVSRTPVSSVPAWMSGVTTSSATTTSIRMNRWKHS